MVVRTSRRPRLGVVVVVVDVLASLQAPAMPPFLLLLCRGFNFRWTSGWPGSQHVRSPPAGQLWRFGGVLRFIASPTPAPARTKGMISTLRSKDYHHVKLKNPYSWYVGVRHGEAFQWGFLRCESRKPCSMPPTSAAWPLRRDEGLLKSWYQLWQIVSQRARPGNCAMHT